LPGGEIAEFDLGQLLRKVVREKSNSEPRPRLDYQQGAVRVRGDEGRLRAVFGHLLQNAKEATPKHGEIQVRLMQEESMAVVEIEDNGSGMSKGFIRERLFTPFDTTKGLTGMGIGVFESREVVRSMGGSVRITSTEGMGTCCRIVLPCLMSDIMIKTSAEDEAGG
jgi:signal transduction histidine kinase